MSVFWVSMDSPERWKDDLEHTKKPHGGRGRYNTATLLTLLHKTTVVTSTSLVQTWKLGDKLSNGRGHKEKTKTTRRAQAHRQVQEPQAPIAEDPVRTRLMSHLGGIWKVNPQTKLT